MDQEQPAFQYKVLEQATDYKDSKIQKSGITSTFTLREIETNRAALQKLQTELEAQIKVQDATTTNIENFHPFVKDMTMEDMHTAGMFYEARAYRDQCQKKLDEVQKLLADEAAEEETIMTTLGFVPTTPEIMTPEAMREQEAQDAAAQPPPVDPVTPEQPQSDVPPTTETPQG